MEYSTKLAIALGCAGLIIIETSFIAYEIIEVKNKEKSGYVLIFGNIIALLSTMIKMIKL